MKRIIGIVAALVVLVSCWAEKRIYFFRAKELPTDVETLDLRPASGLTQLTLNNIYADADARYALFTKDADSWWQVMVETAKGRTVDLSEVDASWYLKLKIRRTVNYTLTLVLDGAGTAEGYPLTTATLPANGEWTELTIPLSQLTNIRFTDRYAGKLLRIHSDAGYAGDVVGIDYCYLTNDPTGVDEGTVHAPKRYYFLTNSKTPLTGTPYQVIDYSAQTEVRAAGWMQWSYVPFPYYSMDESLAVTEQVRLTADCPMADVDAEWYLLMQLRTNIAGTFALRLYLPDGVSYTDTVDTRELQADGSTWNMLCLPLSEMTEWQYSQPTSVLLSLTSVDAVPAGEWVMASLALANERSTTEPGPVVPADPRSEKRIYLLGDGSPLPEQMACTDYRLDQTDYLTASFGNNTTRKATDPYLTLLPTNGWWSMDLAAKTPVDMTAVDDTWTLHTRIRTTSAYRPINLILYKEGNAQLSRYQLTEALLPVAQNGNWIEFAIPMTEYLSAGATLINYNSRIFSFHSDNGGTAGVEVSMEYLYFSHEGESLPAPTPTLPPEAEPELEEVIQGLEWLPVRTTAQKVIRDGRLLILYGGMYFDLFGRPAIQ